MTKKTKIQMIKLFIKTSIVIGVLAVFVLLGFVIRTNHTFEKSDMKKWLALNEKQRIETIEYVVKDAKNQELLIKCVNKIAELENSNEMQIQYAIVLCNKAILQNEE